MDSTAGGSNQPADFGATLCHFCGQPNDIRVHLGITGEADIVHFCGWTCVAGFALMRLRDLEDESIKRLQKADETLDHANVLYAHAAAGCL